MEKSGPRSGRSWVRVTAATCKSHGYGAAGLETGGFLPVRSRWTWQPRLPELWLREQEGRRFREMTEAPEKEV